MANTITKHTIVDGVRNLVVKVHIEGDGSGEETGTVLIDASSYTPAFTDCSLMSFHALFSGFTADLLWDATTDVVIMNVPDYEVNYSPGEVELGYSPIPNNAGTGKTGDILITTIGLGLGDHGTIILKLRKK